MAAEIGLVGYNNMDKRWIPAVQHGYVGGNMTKKLVALSQQTIAQQGPEVMQNVRTVVELPEEVRHANQLASQNFQQFTQAIQNGTFIQQLQSGEDYIQ